MKLPQQKARLFAVESAKGDFQGTVYDNTKFHLAVDLGEKSNGSVMGSVTRPFKFGTSEEAKKWERFKAHLDAGHFIPVLAEFDMVSSSTGVALSLESIIPEPDFMKPAAKV